MSLKKFFKSLLPGIFLLGYTVGTGSVTAMAKAGADYGMTLLWAVLLSCYITYFLIDQYGRFTIISGETPLAAFRKYIHPAVGIFFIVALTVHVSGSIMGVMGIMADLTHEWTANFIDGGLSQVFISVIFITAIYLLFLDGRTERIQKILAFIIGIMAFSFLINFFVLTPPVEEIAKGLIPNVPAIGNETDAFLIIASIVGTTVFSGLFILRGTLVKEAEWTLKDLRIQRRDAAFSGFLMFLVCATIMAAAAGTLHAQGIGLENVSEMISILEPLAGTFTVGVFAIGVIAAGVSSQFPNVSLPPWLLDDYKGLKSNLRKKEYRIFAFFFSLLGLVVPIFNARPVAVMIASQAFGALILPITVGCIFYLGNKQSVVGDKPLTKPANLQLALIFVFSLIMSYMSYNGLIATIQAVF